MLIGDDIIQPLKQRLWSKSVSLYDEEILQKIYTDISIIFMNLREGKYFEINKMLEEMWE
jgi:hypothetical protein